MQRKAYPGDRVQCRSWGTYSRTDGSRPNLPQVPSGTFEVGRGPGPLQTTMAGADALVAYEVAVSIGEVL